MKRHLYFVEQGCLLDPADDQYEYYTLNLNNKIFSLYDEDYVVFLSLKEAMQYIDNWHKYYSYCIVHDDIFNITEEQEEEIKEEGNFNEFISPLDETTLYFSYLDSKNKIVIEIDRTEGKLIKKPRQEVINFMEHSPTFSKLRNEKWYEVEDELTNFVCEMLKCKDDTYSVLSVRDLVKSDFEHQLEITDFNNYDDMDKSYQYMVTQLDIHYRNKNSLDDSLNLHDCANIINILDNDDDYTLEETYKTIVKLLNTEE